MLATQFVKCFKMKYLSKEHVCTIPRLHLEEFRDDGNRPDQEI